MREHNRQIDSVVKILEDEIEKKLKEAQSTTKFAIVVYSVGLLGLLMFFFYLGRDIIEDNHFIECNKMA